LNIYLLLLFLLEKWNDGMMECWKIGMMERWKIGMMECWKSDLPIGKR